MYSGRQRDVRERRAHQEWDAPSAFDPDGTLEADEGRERETTGSWGLQLQAGAGAA
jgi:hypothetical protein